MIQLPCPHCGPRNVDEFRHVDEVVARPEPGAVTTAAWRAYLYLRSNPAGWTIEHWLHVAGCGRYCVVERDTVTNLVRAARPAGGA